MIHIDFGHILDNRKQFAGMDKDRIDFFLSYDFVKVRILDHFCISYFYCFHLKLHKVKLL